MHAESLLLVGPEKLVWTLDDLGTPGPNEVLVETLAGTISIGTELPHYLGNSRGNDRHYPAMTGYESVARVLACGDRVHQLKPGDRIFSFYGHRTHAIIPAEKAIRVPTEVNDEIALLSILSCDVAKGVRKLAPEPGDAVLITGGGTIGLLTLWTLVQNGLRQIDLVEPLPQRCELAVRFGARAVFDPIDDEATMDNYAYGFECSSRDAAFGLLQRTLRQNGAICVLADGNLEPLALTPDFHHKELRIAGSSDGWDYHAHARWFFEHAQDHAELLEQLFEWHVTATELPATFRRLAHGAERPNKVFVRYRP